MLEVVTYAVVLHVGNVICSLVSKIPFSSIFLFAFTHLCMYFSVSSFVLFLFVVCIISTYLLYKKQKMKREKINKDETQKSKVGKICKEQSSI